jgi:hypothetical protein
LKIIYQHLPTVEIAGRKLVGRVLFGLLVLLSAAVGAAAGLLLVYSTDLPQVEELEALPSQFGHRTLRRTGPSHRHLRAAAPRHRHL